MSKSSVRLYVPIVHSECRVIFRTMVVSQFKTYACETMVKKFVLGNIWCYIISTGEMKWQRVRDSDNRDENMTLTFAAPQIALSLWTTWNQIELLFLW